MIELSIFFLSGDLSDLEPPLPISNREVKQISVDDSVWATVCESRSSPGFNKESTQKVDFLVAMIYFVIGVRLVKTVTGLTPALFVIIIYLKISIKDILSNNYSELRRALTTNQPLRLVFCWR